MTICLLLLIFSKNMNQALILVKKKKKYQLKILCQFVIVLSKDKHLTLHFKVLPKITRLTKVQASKASLPYRDTQFPFFFWCIC